MLKGNVDINVEASKKFHFLKECVALYMHIFFCSNSLLKDAFKNVNAGRWGRDLLEKERARVGMAMQFCSLDFSVSSMF